MSYIRKKIAQAKLDNLFLDLREQEFDIVSKFEDRTIDKEDLLSSYKAIKQYGIIQYKKLDDEYHFEQLGIDTSKSVVSQINRYENKIQSLSVQLMIYDK